MTLAVPGEHMVSNALAAAAVGRELGIPLAEAATAPGGRGRVPLADGDVHDGDGGPGPERRVQREPGIHGGGASHRAVDGGEERLIAVLGEMAELGPISEDEHDRVGELAARIRVDRLVTVGEAARAIARAAVREGMEPGDVASYDDPDERARGRPGVGTTGRPRALQGVAGRGSRDPGRGPAVISILVAGAVGLAVTLLGTPVAIRLFRVWGWGQRIREDGPHTHFEKVGTPTMGGIVMLVALVVAYLATRPTIAAGITFSPAGLALILAAVGFGLVGFVDDYLKVRRKRSLGLSKTAEVHGHRRRLGAVLAHRRRVLRRYRHVDEPLLRPADGLGPRCLLLRVGLRGADVVLARGEPHRWARRARGRVLDPRPRGIRVHRVLAVPAHVRRCSARAEGLLRGRRRPRDAGHRDHRGGDDGRRDGLPVVERRPRAHLHGRHGRARARRAVRRDGDHDEHADAADHPRRPVRHRDDVGDHPGDLVPRVRDDASSGCRRSTITSSSRAGPSSP